MRQTKLGGATRFVFSQLAKVIIKPGRRAAIKACPKRGFTNRGASGQSHRTVVISHPADHVRMRFDVTHDYFLPGHAPQAALVVAAGIGSMVGSLRLASTRSTRGLSPLWS